MNNPIKWNYQNKILKYCIYKVVTQNAAVGSMDR